MSSILKALKRVETLKDLPRDDSPVWPSPLNPQRQAQQSLTRRRKLFIGVFGAVFVLLASTLGWVGWRKYRSVELPSSIEKEPDGAKTASVAETPARHTPSASLREKIVRPVPDPVVIPNKEPRSPAAISGHRTAAPPPAPLQPSSSSPQKTPSSSGGGENSSNVTQTVKLGSAPQAPPPPMEKQPLAQPMKPSPSVKPDPNTVTGQVAGNVQRVVEAPNQGPKPLKEGRLLLQAIAWSSIPEKRMAVISNEVVKEGKNVQGFEVVQIKENAVVIKEKGQTWSLVFAK